MTRFANVRWLTQETTWRWRIRSSRLPKPVEGNSLRFESWSDYGAVRGGRREGCGRVGATGVAAAIANAVFHTTGKRIRDLPITPEKLGAATQTGRCCVMELQDLTDPDPSAS